MFFAGGGTFEIVEQGVDQFFGSFRSGVARGKFFNALVDFLDKFQLGFGGGCEDDAAACTP